MHFDWKTTSFDNWKRIGVVGVGEGFGIAGEERDRKGNFSLLSLCADSEIKATSCELSVPTMA